MEIPTNTDGIKLTLEQQFKLTTLKQQVHDLTLEQAQEYLVECFRQMMIKDNLTKKMFKDFYL